MSTSPAVKSPRVIHTIKSVEPKAPRAPKVHKAPGVVDQVRLAMKPKNRLATMMGFLLGGIVPLATYVVAHYEIDPSKALYEQLATLMVLGGLIYSARTVYVWGKMAFQAPGKAFGFVLLLEGVMTTSHIGWLAMSALVYLICINGVATGVTLSLDSQNSR